MKGDLEAAREALAEYEAEADRDPKIVAEFRLRLDVADREELSRRTYAKARKVQEAATAATLQYAAVMKEAMATMSAALNRLAPVEDSREAGEFLGYAYLDRSGHPFAYLDQEPRVLPNVRVVRVYEVLP